VLSCDSACEEAAERAGRDREHGKVGHGCRLDLSLQGLEAGEVAGMALDPRLEIVAFGNGLCGELGLLRLEILDHRCDRTLLPR
jgi:hypothetical protein